MSLHTRANCRVNGHKHAHIHACTHRYIQAKATLKGSRDQAQLSNSWRQRLRVDDILERPPGSWFEVPRAGGG